MDKGQKKGAGLSPDSLTPHKPTFMKSSISSFRLVI